MSKLPGDLVEEVGLRLGQVHLLQNGDLLGDAPAEMGTQRKIFIYLGFL